MQKRTRIAIVGGIVASLMIVSAVVAIAASNTFVTNGINNVRVKTQTSAYSTSSTSWVPLPGANFNMAVPNGLQKTFIAEFDGESACNGGTGWCSIRILVDGVEMNPASGTDFAFDSAGEDRWEGHSMTRTFGPLSSGQHSFEVQIAVTNAATTFRLDDWTFKVFKAAVAP